MTEQEFNEEANKWADDMVWALVDMKRKANDDERDFLVQEYKDLQKYFTKELQEEIELLKKSDSLCKIIGEQKLKIADLEEQIEKMKTELFAAYGRLSLAKALLTQWLHGGDSNINIVSDTQRFLEVESEKVQG